MTKTPPDLDRIARIADVVLNYLDRIADVVLNYRPKDKARKPRKKRRAKKPAKG